MRRRSMPVSPALGQKGARPCAADGAKQAATSHVRNHGCVDIQGKRNATRRMRLEQLNTWRNGVAHQDFRWSKAERQLVGSTKGTLDDVRMYGNRSLRCQVRQRVARYFRTRSR